MAVEPSTKTVDDIHYTCEMMPGTLSNKTLTRLTILVGRPALVMAAGAIEAEKKENTEELMLHLIQIGVNQIFQGLTPDEAHEVLMALMTGVRFEGCELGKDLSDVSIFDDHFRGKILSAYKVWAWSLGENYRDFLDAALSSPMLSKFREVGTQVLSTKISTLLSQESAPQTEE